MERTEKEGLGNKAGGKGDADNEQLDQCGE